MRVSSRGRALGCEVRQTQRLLKVEALGLKGLMRHNHRMRKNTARMTWLRHSTTGVDGFFCRALRGVGTKVLHQTASAPSETSTTLRTAAGSIWSIAQVGTERCSRKLNHGRKWSKANVRKNIVWCLRGLAGRQRCQLWCTNCVEHKISWNGEKLAQASSLCHSCFVAGVWLSRKQNNQPLDVFSRHKVFSACRI